MKRTSILLIATLMVTLTVWAGAKDQTYTGWISDAKCAAKGDSAGHAACAKKCVENGEKPVMVADNGQKVMPIDNPDAVKDLVGQHVKVSGTVNSSGTLHVDKVQSQ